MSMEEGGSALEFDRESDEGKEMSDAGCDYEYCSDGGDDCAEDDENYTFEDDEHETVYVRNYSGIHFDGNLHDMMREPGKNALYPVYKQLSEHCLVDIQENFYCAMLTIGVKDQILMVQINFPQTEPYFPTAPPRIDLQSKFRAPNEKFNLLFNCHPQLLSSQWNFCTDVVQIIRDLIQLTELYLVDTVDDDYYSGAGAQRLIIKIIRQNMLDVTSLFPDTQHNKLPSFGIVREKQETTAAKGNPKGTGYSAGFSGNLSTKAWDVSAHTMAKLEGVLELTKKVQEEIKLAEAGCSTAVDPMLIDSVYFIFSHTISRTITMEEFFRNLAFYDLVLDCLLPLPAPSSHIAPIQSLMKLYTTVTGGRVGDALEENEKTVIAKLKVLYERLNQSASTTPRACTPADAGATAYKEHAMVIDQESADGNSSCRTLSASASKKRHFNGTDASSTAATEAQSELESGVTSPDASSKSASSWWSSASSLAKSVTKAAVAVPTASSPNLELRNVAEFTRVVELEDAFATHKYASDMTGLFSARLNAKWFRRLHMELESMPESLPDNVIVFSGMSCSQPNLMKILMFPESPDTPYCGGCFEFDAFLSADYPAQPPKVNLITTGYGTVRFNPNLYNCGKVCLSLLGTWSGETWNPEVSSMSQVINSILFLIFVELPYFNEPGYQASQGTSKGDEASAGYNAVIRSATLHYAYLDHFKKRESRQLSPWIIPMLCRNWRTKGHATALKWASSQPALSSTIDAIEEEVSKVVGPADPPLVAPASSAGASSSADTSLTEMSVVTEPKA